MIYLPQITDQLKNRWIRTALQLKQAKRSPGSGPVLQASEGSSLFRISLCMDCNVCKGALRTHRTDMKKDHCDYECCKNKTSSDELLCLET